jgi:hypothetical protein
VWHTAYFTILITTSSKRNDESRITIIIVRTDTWFTIDKLQKGDEARSYTNRRKEGLFQSG